jgi:homoaconitase/3-isopropylmalate dehydratase large subunit
VGASRRQRSDGLEPGDDRAVYADLLPASDGTAPFAIHTFNQITGGATIDPRRRRSPTITSCSPASEDDDKQTSIGRAFAGARLKTPYYATPGDGIFHFYFPEQGLVLPGQIIPGRRLAQPRVRRVRRGRHRRGFDDARLRMGDRLRLLHARQGAARRLRRRAQPWVSGKDIVLELLRRWGAKQSQGCRWSSSTRRVSCRSPYRNTIANMMAEAEAQNGIFAADEITDAGTRKGDLDAAVPADRAGRDARYAIDEELSLDCRADDRQAVQPGNAFPPRRSRASASSSTRR